MTKALVLAGTRSGCGKTSVALGLMRALARQGLRVQPFKAGPDFIDPGLHARAAGRASHNLDTWMMPPEALRACFARFAGEADVVLIEGAMGLFDGRSGADEEGSTAHLAKLLGLPVLLVLDVAAQARSVAAVALGFARFDPALRLSGVVLNRVASPRHEAILRQAMATLPDVPVLGCLPRAESLGLASRHLGLVVAEDVAELDARLEALADWVEQGVDIPALLAGMPELRLLEISAPAPHVSPDASPDLSPAVSRGSRVRIGLARDRAFCFVYAENLRLLEEAGAEIVPFSPLCDAALPKDLDGLYLPGGYPELSAAALSANAPMLAAVRAFCGPGGKGRPVWAECGGFMYLQRALVDSGGAEHAQCGVFPGRAVMRTRRAALGYREARTLAPGPLGPEGTLLRGHEFHYSELEQAGLAAGEQGQAAFALTASDGQTVFDGAALGNVVGGYFHAHLGSNPAAARSFVAACRAAHQKT
ncbi:MAG: cobyrinate a,c-diamide synthase [Deltaproteobacteria bacterium HGW-Deltaproteobacteria-8]|jgi:cobyrinic acid a,c-diamide synthase|nr:MAG: cobyrinate a,c-diamide synthase [Deltaproteobacteria bacterium HGW-Deltaproteobacteria-8]